MALFLPSLDGGGTERVMLELGRGLYGRGFAVDVLVTRPGGAYWGSVPQGVRLIDFNLRKAIFSLPRLLRYIRREQPDVLVATMDTPNALALVAQTLFARNLALIIRQENTFSKQLDTAGFQQRVSMLFVRWLAHRADAIVAVSNGVADDFKRTAPKAAHLVHTIFNPVVTPELFESARASVTHPWFGDPQTPVIMTAGRLTFQKDHPTLLRAFAEVVRSHPARLLILGEGPDRVMLTTLARQLGIADTVDFVGFQTNPYAWMARARIFVMSSRFEGLPTVLIEALACGTPVVSTDCLSGPREILEGGELGPLVPVGDWRGLARAMLDVLDNPVSQERLLAKANRYSADAAVSRHVELVTRLTARRGATAGGA